MSRSHRRISCLLFFLLGVGAAFRCSALDLEAGLWNHIPMGINFVGSAYAFTRGEIALDPTLMIEDAEVDLHTVVVKYIHAFEFVGNSARVDITQGYQEGRWEGVLDGVTSSVNRSGLTDTFVRFAISLYGAPPLSGKEFNAYRASNRNDTIVGAGLVVRLPTGDYIEDKLINIGQNRVAFRPQLGVVANRGDWTGEVTADLSFYTDNDEFYQGTTLEQAPLLLIQAHLTRRLDVGESVAFSLGYNNGGENTVDGVAKDDRNQNTAWALTYSYPISRQSGLKLSYISSRTLQSTGIDTSNLALAIVYAW
jgi:hypothetical protein